MEYIAFLHKEADSDFGVSFPDFPGCVTAGETLEEARQMAQEALDLHVEGMIEDGHALPEPSDLDTLAQDSDFAGAIAMVVRVTPPSKTVRVNLTLPKDALAAIDEAAKLAGTNRSTYMVRASLHASKTRAA